MLKLFLIFISGVIFSHSSFDLKAKYLQKGEDYTPRTKHIKNGKAEFTNHLILANSPYLLQHAHNPVRWYGFNDEAFELAKNQNKLIFLSIGYATCHWCHVMEEESFEDLTVAKILNKDFISIKVDREVLPDVDSHFMDIAIALNGTGGWPLNVVLTPNGDGFFAGTYFPKNNLIANLNNLQNIWQKDKNRIFKTVKVVKNAIAEKQKLAAKLPRNLQKIATKNLLKSFDEFYGGFGDAPKFPRETSLLMLIDEQFRNPSKDKLTAITTTLDNMASGGIYDLVGGGFHRYATDNAWLFPHFEKMLYNQAQMIMVYTKAYQLTKKPLYKRIIKQTIEYLKVEMQDKNGGFYSATDADSLAENGENEEGAFFIWNEKELKNILGADFKEFAKHLDLSDYTNFEDKKVLHFQDVNTISNFKNLDKAFKKIYQARQKRHNPILDNKILLSWNALLLKAFVVASEIDSKYLQDAEKLADFLTKTFNKNKLLRVKIDNQVSQIAVFKDYAYFADGLLALFDKIADKKYLNLAKKLTDVAIVKFWDDKNFGFKTSNNKRISLKKEIYDGAMFSSNGVIYSVLNKLTNRLQDERYSNFANNSIKYFSSIISKNPSSYATMVKGFNDKKYGEIAQTIYLYNGKLKVQKLKEKVIIDIAKGWHINANKVLQKGLIATKLTGVKNAIYPKSKLINLGWSDEKIAVYENKIEIKFAANDDLIKINLQACSEKICLPPVDAILK
jgi:uncharacterized protein YyaL (SSP411 family)